MIGSLPNKFKAFYSKYSTDQEYAELIRTSMFALSVRMVGVGTGFLVTVITGRYFGAYALGIVSICLAILSFASVFAKMGIDVALLKYISAYWSAGNKEGVKATYISTLKAVIPVSFFISLLLYVSAPFMAEKLFHKPFLTDVLKVNAWLTLPLVLLIINAEALRSLKKIRAYTFFQTVAVSTLAAFLLFFVSFFYDFAFVPAYVQFVSIGLSSVMSVFVWFHYSGFFKTTAKEIISIKNLVSTSAAMFTTTLMQLMMSWAGTLVLAAYCSESDVGVFNAMSRISIFTNIAILAINSLVMPRFASHFAEGDHYKLKQESHQATRLIFLSSIPVFAVLFTFPHFILSIFGKDFPGHENELYILLVTQFIVSFAGLPSQLLNMTGRQKNLRNVSIFAAVINVGMCLLLTPILGLKGTCIAQLAGTFTWNLLSILAVKRGLGFYTFFWAKQ